MSDGPQAPGALPRGIAPSILAADFDRLGEQVQTVLDAGAPVIHVDVMDGHFVPPITMGPIVVEALRDRVKQAGATMDVHLMIERPESQVAAFAKAGADVITIHQEATPHVHHALAAIRDAGVKSGLAICPGTAPEVLEPSAELIDLALCMSVNPGWGGQRFIASSVAKIERMRELLGDAVEIEVDGGVDASTAPLCAGAGAGILVAGSAVFGQPDPAAALGEIAAAAGFG
jgi:ribulose-phosphate 3-epimerase